MRHCYFCEMETIPGAALMAAGDGAPGGVVPVCTKCGKVYKGEGDAPAATVAAQAPQPTTEHAEAKVLELRPKATTLAGATVAGIIEASRARLAVVDAEIARLKSLQAERKALARIVRASKEKP